MAGGSEENGRNNTRQIRDVGKTHMMHGIMSLVETMLVTQREMKPVINEVPFLTSTLGGLKGWE